MTESYVASQNSDRYNQDRVGFESQTYERDLCGFTYLHHCCARGHLELAYLILEQKLVDANCQDNYGRTPLFWTFWSGEHRISALLVNKGAKLDAEDEVGDNVLHIAAQHPEHFHSLQRFLFALLKYDNPETLQYTQALHRLLHTHNHHQNLSPLDLAQKLQSSILTLLRAVDNICKKRLDEQCCNSIDNLILRSGSFIGKELNQALHSISMEAKYEMSLSCKKHDSFVIYLKNKGNVAPCERLVIPLSSIAFLIIRKNKNSQSHSLEITLSSPPLYEARSTKAINWSSQEHAIFNSSCTAFNIILQDHHLQNFKQLLAKSEYLTEFKELCYCKKSSSSEVSKSPAKDKSHHIMQNLIQVPNKKNFNLHVLREKFSQIRLSPNSPIYRTKESPTHRNKEESINTTEIS